MHLWITVLVLAVALVSRPGSASADLITIEPDAFVPGTDVTHASPGITLWTITPQDPFTALLTPTYVRQNPECLTGPCDAVTGSQGFSPNPGASGSLYGQYQNAKDIDFCVRLSAPACINLGVLGQSALWMQFDTGADFVEIAGAWTSDFLWVKAYDANFQTVDLQAVPDVLVPRNGAGFTSGFSDVTAPAGNIKYVIAGSVGGVIGLDRIRYHVVSAVPEPSTLLLCGVGFVGLLRSRRRPRR
jgi:hypothetical protein